MNIAVQNGAIHHRNNLNSILTDRTDDLRRIAGLVDQVAGIDTLGREAEIEILTALETRALFQDGLEQLLGRAGIRRGLQNDHRALGQVLRDRLSGRADIADVRLLMRIQGGGHADSDKVHVLNKAEVGGCAQHTVRHQFFQIGVDNVADIVLAGVDQIHFLLLNVKADGLEAVLGLVHRQRQTDITETTNAHQKRFVLNLFNQLFFNRHTHSISSTLLLVSIAYFFLQTEQVAVPFEKSNLLPHWQTYPRMRAGVP